MALASLCFRGFTCNPEEVERLVGKRAELIGKAGVPTAPGRRPLTRSFVCYQLALPLDTRLDEMVPRLITHVGGVEAVAHASTRVAPEFLEVDLLLPVKDSPEQEGGYIEHGTLQLLAQLGANLSLGFTSHWAEA